MGLGQSVTAGKTLENHTPRGGGANTTTKVLFSIYIETVGP